MNDAPTPTPTPRTDAIAHRGLGSVAYIAEMTSFARQLERENQTFRNAQKACENCDAPRVDRIAELERELAETAKDYRCLADLLDGHDATECRANLSKLKDAVQTLNDCADYLNRRLAEERALADRLATWAQEHRNAYMGQVPHVDCGCGDCQILPVLDADLAAWKEARK